MKALTVSFGVKMKKIKKYKNVYSLIVMIVISCLTQIVSVMKSSTVAGLFGLSNEMDAYNFANSIVTFVFGLIAAGIPTVVIPSYVKEEKRERIDTFLTMIYGFLAVLVFFLLVLRVQIVGFFSSREEVFVSVASSILIILLFTQYLSSVPSVTTAYFQCNNKYNIPKVINLITQSIVVVILLVLKDMNIYQYAFIISGGVLLNFLTDGIIAIRYGWRYKPTFWYADPKVKEMVAMFIPTLLSSSIYKLSLFIDSIIASHLDVGKLTVLSYSNHLTSIVNSVVIGNLLIYMYPKIIEKVKNDAPQHEFWDSVLLFHSIVCLIIAGFVSVGREGISLLFEHGAFDSNAAYLVYIGTTIYICGQNTNIVRDLIYRYFYAKGDTKTTTANSVLVSVVNISVSLILVRIIGFYGIIIGTVVASAVSLTMILVRYNNKFTIEVKIKKLAKDFLTNILIGTITIIVVFMTKKVLHFNNIIEIILFGMESVIVFVVLTVLMNRKVLQTLKNI